MKLPIEIPHVSHGQIPKIMGNLMLQVKFLAETLDFSLFTLDIHGGITDVPWTRRKPGVATTLWDG